MSESLDFEKENLLGMQIDIAQHIEKLLFEHETVIVPTFGGFTATRSPANLDAVSGVIAPPSKTLDFNENLTVDDGILVHDISSTFGISDDESRRLILDFVEHTISALNQREIVTLPGVGRLYKNYAQKVQFLPDTTNFNTNSFGLPKINFASSPRPASEENNGAHNGSYATNGHSSTNGSKNPETQTPTTSPQELVEQAHVEQAPIPTTNGMASVNREVKKTGFTALTWALLAFFVLSIAVAVYFALTESNDNPPNSTEPTESQAIPNNPLPNMGVIPPVEEEKAVAVEPVEDDDADESEEIDEYASKKMEAEASIVQKSTEKPEGRRCVLIIGTFNNRNNVSKLLRKLENAGYDTYHRRVGGHQVGIEFYYTSLYEVQNKINELQELTGEDKIWIKKK